MKVGWDVCGGATLTELTGWFEGDVAERKLKDGCVFGTAGVPETGVMCGYCNELLLD
jgi:hypothetical protein